MRVASLGRVTALVFVTALSLGGPASAQMDSRDAIALQNQILELRQQIQIMQQRGGGAPTPVYRPDRAPGGGGDGSLTAQLLDRVAALEDQVRTLRGQVDELTNQQQRQAADFAKQIGDLTFAMQNSSGGGGGAPARPAPPLPTMSPPPSSLGGAAGGSPAGPPPRTPELAMQEGNAALARRDYVAAEASAREVLAKKGPRAADAQFLLAQAEMGQRNYQQAAPDYYDAYNRARTSARAPDALLGVANSLIALGDKASACDALAKLRAEFPTPRAEIRDAETSARQRAACH